MADCLSVLREYHMTKKPIKVEDDLVIFGDKAWPKDTKTNYMRCCYEPEQVEYYTLYSLVYFLQNSNLAHPQYVKEASAKLIPVVRLPDRKGLEQYLEGITSSSSSIDRTAPIQIAIPRGEKRTLSSAAYGKVTDAKKIRSDDSSKSKLLNEDGSMPVNSLTEAIPQAKLQELIEKRKAVLKKSTKPVISDDFVAPPNIVENKLGLSAEEAIKYITSKERLWRTRSTILQSSGSKLVGRNVLEILNSVKAIEEGSNLSNPKAANGKEEAAKEKQNQPTHYNRYDQEKFKGREDTEGFKIDTMGTYHGLSLKSVNQTPNNKSPVAAATPHISTQHSNLLRRNPSVPQKKASKTPIIILPGGSSSLITIFNAKDILQDLKFVSTEQKRQEGARRDAEVLLHRSKTSGGQTISVPYRVVDLPSKLTMEEWDRVVACFVQGPAWQFKGWPWLAQDGSPTEIFLHMRAFHIQWDDLALDKNVQKWDVHILKLSRNHRHLDRAVILKFWEVLDRWVGTHKPNLRT